MGEYDWSWIHRLMLSDRIRTEAFRDAIEKVVKPGDVVADVGAGTGILSLFAARAGAKRIYAIERTPIGQQAELIAQANGYGDTIVLVRDDAISTVLPENVDVVVSEWLGNGGVEEDMLPAVMSIRDRHLKPGGVMIPATMTTFLAPVESADAFAMIDEFNDDVYGFDYAPMRAKAVDEMHLTRFESENLLAEGQVVADFDIHDVQEPYYQTTCVFTVARDGTLHGLAGWFDAAIADGVMIRTGPGAPPTHWYHVYYPIPQATAVSQGEKIRTTITAMPSVVNIEWRWKIEIFGADSSPSTDKPQATFEHFSEGHL